MQSPVPSSASPDADRSPDNDAHPEHDTAAKVVDQIAPWIAERDLPQVEMIVEETIGQITMHHSGPLPRARELAAYKEIDATFAERIMRMAEKEQDFRHVQSADILKRAYGLKARGQHYALALALIVLLFAFGLAFFGNTDMAGKVAIWTLVGVVGVFVGGRAVDALGKRREGEGDAEG